MQGYRFLILLLFVFLGACGSDNNRLSEYNDNLYLYEKRLHQCSALESEDIKGIKVQGVTDKVIRIGLAYYYIKNSLGCTSKEEGALITTIDELTKSQVVAEYIISNARNLKETLRFNLDQLIEPSKQFNSLSPHEQKILASMSISNRPFSPSAALKYYIDD